MAKSEDEMSEEKRGPGRPRVEGRKPSEGRPPITLRLAPDLEAWVSQQIETPQDYLRRLITEDRAKPR